MTDDQHANRIAASQHGLLTFAQARTAGLSRKQVHSRVRLGQWVRLAPGVYRIDGAPVTWHQRVLAAVLSSAEGAVASHATAAGLHGLIVPLRGLHVTVPATAGARGRLAVAHRSTIDPRDRCRLGPIPVTTVSRTLCDLAGTMRSGALAAIVDDAFCSGKSCVGSVERSASRRSGGSGSPGIGRLRRAIEVWTPAIEPGSPAEMRLLRRLREWDLPDPVPQLSLRDGAGALVARIDLAWPAERIGLEYDSDRYHNPRGWAAEERRAAAVERLGWRLRHVAKPDLLPSSTWLRDDLSALFTRSAVQLVP